MNLEGVSEEKRKEIETLVIYLINYRKFRGTHKQIDKLIQESIKRIKSMD